MTDTDSIDLEIRRATPDDYDAVCALTADVWADRGGDYLPEIYHDWLEEPGADGTKTFVAETAAGELAGIVQAVMLSPDEAWFQSMRVDSAYRRQGVSQRLNEATQTYLRQWSTQSTRDNPAVMHDQASLPWFAELNRSLNDELDDDAFARRIRASHQQLCELAREILATSTERYPHLDPHALRAALAEWGDRVASANTAHQSLLPGRQAAQ